MTLPQNAKDHFIAAWPNEACGYMKDGVFYPMENLAEDKSNCFDMDPRVLLKKPDVILHSHISGVKPVNPDHDLRSPSEADLRSQMMTGVEWGIVVTDGQTCDEPVYWGNPKNRPPLLGRTFIYNLQDCFALAQDWYYQEFDGFILKNFPRTPFWHQHGKNYIVEQFENYGFTKVDLKDLQRGDALIYAIRSPIPRHIGIYLGDNKVISHWAHRVSAIDDYGLWGRYVALAVRPPKP